jgi:hypothetical protein
MLTSSALGRDSNVQRLTKGAGACKIPEYLEYFWRSGMEFSRDEARARRDVRR